LKWKRAENVLCDTKVPPKLKEKFHQTAVRPMMLYGTVLDSEEPTQEKKSM
jgi:hypothetical protein